MKKKLSLILVVVLVVVIVSLSLVGCSPRTTVYNKLVKNLQVKGTYSVEDNSLSIMNVEEDYILKISVNLDDENIFLHLIEDGDTMSMLLSKNATTSYYWLYSDSSYGKLSGYIDLACDFEDDNFVVVEDYAKTPLAIRGVMRELCIATAQLTLLGFNKYLLVNDIADDLRAFGIKK